MIKHSRQRDAVMEYLSGRKDHPTAEMVYENLRKDLPNISLATVYRNLSLLTELGRIRRIPTEDGADRYDGNLTAHYHFVCDSCGALIDLEMDPLDRIEDAAAEHFDGRIGGHRLTFYGTCPACTGRTVR